MLAVFELFHKFGQDWVWWAQIIGKFVTVLEIFFWPNPRACHHRGNLGIALSSFELTRQSLARAARAKAPKCQWSLNLNYYCVPRLPRLDLELIRKPFHYFMLAETPDMKQGYPVEVADECIAGQGLPAWASLWNVVMETEIERQHIQKTRSYHS